MLGQYPVVAQTHHHQIGQLAASHVVSLIDCLVNRIETGKEHRLLVKLDLQGVKRHFHGEGNTGRCIPVPINCRVASEFECHVSVVDPANIPKIASGAGKLLECFKVTLLLPFHGH
ncbi:hypothetical protein D9M70_589860 [compost metagenome]